MMAFPIMARLAVPYARMELPGWGKLLKAAGVFDHARWHGAPTYTIRGKLHGYRMPLSLESWSERQTYFLGRYYELGTQGFLMACIRPGDTLVDVGGNIGMMTLLGARLVGDAGCVHTFEPNPHEGARIRRTLEDNDIKNVTLHPVGLSDAPDKLTLSIITKHSGMGTLAQPKENEAKLVSATYTVDVVRGDDDLPADLKAPVTMKVDIEGFECRALRGLSGTLAKYRPAVVTEVHGEYLQRAGATVKELFELMLGQGYQAYDVSLRRKWGSPKLSLKSIDKHDESMDTNVAWVAPGTVHEARLKPFMVV
jgi:FkbM family methyltransferase